MQQKYRLQRWLLGLLLLACLGLPAQGPLNWVVLNARYRLGKDMRLFAEGQVRSAGTFSRFNYHELKGGGSFHIGPNFNGLVGFGNYQTYPETGTYLAPRTQNEWRLWEEVALGQFVGRLRFEHRYRIEQRWLTQGFRTRFRYRLGLVLPLNRKRIEDHTLYVNAYHELFMGPTAPYFERNRVVLGGGYRFDFLNLQLNYLRQFDYSLSGARTRHYMQVALLFEFGRPGEGARSNPMPED
jgi:Protein of unknown function (DUF2490)